jgi:hypothetical protein
LVRVVGAGGVTGELERLGETEPRPLVLGREFGRDGEDADRLCRHIPLEVDRPQIAKRPGVLRLKIRGVDQVFRCTREISLAGTGNPQGNEGIRVGGIEGDRILEKRDRLFKKPLIAVDHPQIGEERHVLGVTCRGAPP